MTKAFKILPKNYLADWGNLSNYDGTMPIGWLISTAGTYSEDTATYKFSPNSFEIISPSNGSVYRTIPNGEDYSGRTFTFGVWANCTSTSAYIKIDDGVSVSTSHLTSLNTWEEVSVTRKLDYSATQLRVELVGGVTATAYFDSGVLCEGEDLFTEFDDNIDISSWQPSLNLRQDEYEISQREGSKVGETHLASRSIKVAGMVVGTDVRSCRNHFDELMKSILAWQRDEKRHMYLYEDRVADVFLQKFDWSYLNGLKDIKFTLNLKNADSTTRSVSKYRDNTVIAATVTEFNFAYNGNNESLPQISLIANQAVAITTCILENLTTGESFTYAGTVPVNVALDIDSDLGTVKNSSINALSDFTGDFLKVVRGTNYFRFSGSNCTINIDYYERYL